MCAFLRGGPGRSADPHDHCLQRPPCLHLLAGGVSRGQSAPWEAASPCRSIRCPLSSVTVSHDAPAPFFPPHRCSPSLAPQSGPFALPLDSCSSRCWSHQRYQCSVSHSPQECPMHLHGTGEVGPPPPLLSVCAPLGFAAALAAPPGPPSLALCSRWASGTHV